MNSGNYIIDLKAPWGDNQQKNLLNPRFASPMLAPAELQGQVGSDRGKDVYASMSKKLNRVSKHHNI